MSDFRVVLHKAAAVADFAAYNDAQLQLLIARFDAALNACVTAHGAAPAGTLTTRRRLVAAFRSKRSPTVVRLAQIDTPVELRRERSRREQADREAHHAASLVVETKVAERGTLSLAQRSQLRQVLAAVAP